MKAGKTQRKLFCIWGWCFVWAWNETWYGTSRIIIDISNQCNPFAWVCIVAIELLGTNQRKAYYNKTNKCEMVQKRIHQLITSRRINMMNTNTNMMCLQKEMSQRIHSQFARKWESYVLPIAKASIFTPLQAHAFGMQCDGTGKWNIHIKIRAIRIRISIQPIFRYARVCVCSGCDCWCYFLTWWFLKFNSVRFSYSFECNMLGIWIWTTTSNMPYIPMYGAYTFYHRSTTKKSFIQQQKILFLVLHFIWYHVLMPCARCVTQMLIGCSSIKTSVFPAPTINYYPKMFFVHAVKSTRDTQAQLTSFFAQTFSIRPHFVKYQKISSHW